MSSPITSGGGCLGVASLLARASIANHLPSSCGMLVYRDETSIDANIQFSGNLVVSIRLMKALESFK